MAINLYKWASTPFIPTYSYPYLAALTTLSLGSWLWWWRVGPAYLPWRGLITLVLGLGIALNPITWGAGRGIAESLGQDGSSGPAFAAGLLFLSHGLCLSLQSLGRQLVLKWQLPLPTVLLALAIWHGPESCAGLQFASQAVLQHL